MMLIHRSVRFSLLLLALGSAQVQAFDLLEAWQTARTQDPLFASARAMADAGRTKNLQADALNKPQLTLNAGAAGVSSDNKITDARFSNAQFAGGTTSNKGTTDFRTRTDGGLDLNLNLRAEYSLYDALRSGSAKQLNKQAALAEVQLIAESQQLMLRVAQAYFDVLLAKDNLATLKAQQAAVAEALASVKARFAEGDLAIIDTHETQARFDLLASQVLEAESNLQLTREALGDVTGNRDAALAALPGKVDFQRYVSGDMQSWLSRAQSNDPQVHAQQLEQEIAQAETGKFKDRYAPTVNLVAQAGGERLQGLASGDADLTNRQASLGVQVSVPLYSGGMRDARYQEAVALEEKALSQTDAARQGAARDARAAWMAVTVGQSQVKALEQAVRSAEIKLDSSKLGRDVGDRTTLDVLNSEQELHNIRLALARGRYQVLQALLNLSASAGELDETRLKEINQVFSQ